MITRVTARLVLASTAAVLLAGCGGGSGSYSAEQAQSAFAEQGYVLVEPPPDPAGIAPNPWQTDAPMAFVPRRGPAFFVFVGEVADPEEVWAHFDPDHGSTTVDERQGNVAVMSDTALSATHRERIRAALASLPS